MILSDLLFARNVTPDLEKSMDVYTMRHKVISNNIANAMTPGYRAEKVSFEEEYQAMLRKPNPQHLPLTQTHEEHMRNRQQKTFSQIHPYVEYKDDPINDTGLNNVDIDREMAEMAENSLRFEMSTKLMTKRLTTLKSAIKGR